MLGTLQESAHLRYHRIVATLLGQRRHIDPIASDLRRYKPMLWFVKGSYSGHAIQDVIRSDGSDKNFHDHGQSDSEFA
jgi:hypothetical protein